MKHSITIIAAMMFTTATACSALAAGSGSTASSAATAQTASSASSTAGATGAQQRSTNSTDRFMYIANGSDKGEGWRRGNPDSQALCGYAGIPANVYFFDCQQ